MDKVVVYNVGLYCRLSLDDGNVGESGSIQTQKIILSKYAKDNNLNIYKIYVDDGYSGLNFNRPAFNEMLNDIESGKINMVITKDLSRLGRDYIQTGYYTEIYFPDHKVRYVALSDGIDTINQNNDIAPFKNILNDIYAKDLSRKVKLAKRNRTLLVQLKILQPRMGALDFTKFNRIFRSLKYQWFKLICVLWQ